MNGWPPYAKWDLSGTDLLPSDWDEQIMRTVASDAVQTVLSGESAQGREEKTDYEIQVLVVVGSACKAALPWLWSLYEKELREFSSKVYGRPLYPALDLRSSININCLRGVGARYETHVDTNPLTGLLFASDATENTGGALVFKREGGEDATVWPRKGLFIAFDARLIAHYVSPLLRPIDRISVPMNYYDDPQQQVRPPGLDDRLYTPADKAGHDVR